MPERGLQPHNNFGAGTVTARALFLVVEAATGPRRDLTSMPTAILTGTSPKRRGRRAGAAAFAELVARIRALARRSQPALPPVLMSGDIRLDPGQRVASRGGRRLELSRKEFAVLELLVAADGAPLSADELLDRAWDEYVDSFSNVVKVTVSRLRRKLGEPEAIQTVPHGGYRICA